MSSLPYFQARPLLVNALETGEYEDLVDPRLENNFAKNEMSRMIEVAAACVRHSAPKRPRMVQVRKRCSQFLLNTTLITLQIS